MKITVFQIVSNENDVSYITKWLANGLIDGKCSEFIFGKAKKVMKNRQLTGIHIPENYKLSFLVQLTPGFIYLTIAQTSYLPSSLED